METSICSDTIYQPSIYNTASTSGVPAFISRPAGHGSICPDENCAHIFPWAQAVDHQNSFCNNLAFEVEKMEDRDFQTFRNEAVKLLSGIQSRKEKRNHQPQQATLPRSSSTTSTHVPTTFRQQPLPRNTF